VIPREYTCEGRNASPPLSWSGAPPDTRSFVLICDDPDAPGGDWFHWALYDLPAQTSGVPEGFKPKAAMKQGLNDFRRKRYDGPCPPPGHGEHRYRFKVYALSVETLALKNDAHCRDVEQAARSHALGVAELIGTYERAG